MQAGNFWRPVRNIVKILASRNLIKLTKPLLFTMQTKPETTFYKLERLSQSTGNYHAREEELQVITFAAMVFPGNSRDSLGSSQDSLGSSQEISGVTATVT